MSISVRLILTIAAALLSLVAQRPCLAASATWATNPTSGDWNTAANWKPPTVPNSSSDIATFATSNQTEIATSALTEIAGINFKPGADSFTITAGITATQSFNLKLSGSGIVNSSGELQTFLCGSNGFAAAAFLFYNSATAGDMTSFGGEGGSNFDFNDSSSAGSATFDLGGGFGDSGIFFFDSSTAENATITTTFGVIDFLDDSTAANAHITVSGPSFMEIFGDGHGGHVVATCFGGTIQGTNISFAENATAEEGTYTAVGASTVGEFGSFIEFLGSATADRATFIINGGMGAGLEGRSLNFVDTTTAGNATITANGGVDGSDGGVISFQEQSRGGNASISLSGNATLDISTHRAPGVIIGSLAGDGLVFLGVNTLTVGSNNLSTAFSGVIQGSGSLAKIGSGTLTFEGGATNQYIADTVGLILVSGSIINLNFTGSPDIIASLVVDGIPQLPGVYGSAKSGAPNPLSEFAGLGTVQVTAGPSPTPTPTATATPTVTATATATVTPTASARPTPTSTPRPTPTPRSRITPRPRPTPPPRP